MVRDGDGSARQAAAAGHGGVPLLRRALGLLVFLAGGAVFIGLPVLASLSVMPYLWPGAASAWSGSPHDLYLRLAMLPGLFFMQTQIFPRMAFQYRLTVPDALLGTAAVQGAGLVAWSGCGALVAGGVLDGPASGLTIAAVAASCLAGTGMAAFATEALFARRRRRRRDAARAGVHGDGATGIAGADEHRKDRQR